MSKTLIGMVTFGNLPFTKIVVETVKQYTNSSVDFFMVVGKPEDNETPQWLDEQGIKYHKHNENHGFPASLNDIYDYGFIENTYDYLITAGNDIAVYPGTIDNLIKVADTTDWEWISSSQFDVKTLVNIYPEAAKYFDIPNNFKFTMFDKRPWELHIDNVLSEPDRIEPDVIKDVHNLCLYKKCAIEKIGYVDVNFYPAYYEDNDYARRAVNLGLKTCALTNSVYFHFWSRTIHQGSGGSTGRYFDQNRRFYITKWGGDFAQERWKIPFNGMDFPLTDKIILPATLGIFERKDELEIARYWRNLSG